MPSSCPGTVPATLPWEADFDPSRAIARITHCTPDTLQVQVRGQSPAMLLEGVAAVCGLHARWRHGFRVQVYLASMIGVRLQPTQATSAGARLLQATTRALLYEVTADFLAAPAQVTLAMEPLDHPLTLFAERFQCLLSSPPCADASTLPTSTDSPEILS
jgi:hypothetical protein